MTRQDITNEYSVVNGRIVSPGKFENEMVYVPYFWDFYLNGFADDDDGKTLKFKVSKEDREQFPELKGKRTVRLQQTDTGFVVEI